MEMAQAKTKTNANNDIEDGDPNMTKWNSKAYVKLRTNAIAHT